jgi:hypothetical protein
MTKITMVDWYNFSKDIYTKSLENQDVQKIVGVEKIVVINKNKFKKYKYHRGIMKEGKWIVEVQRDKCQLYIYYL